MNATLKNRIAPGRHIKALTLARPGKVARALVAATLSLVGPLAQATVLTPSQATVTGGGVSGGTLAELVFQDGLDLILDKCSGPVSSTTQVAKVEFSAYYGQLPVTMDLLIVDRMGQGGNYVRRLDVFNFNLSQWETVAFEPVNLLYKTRGWSATNPVDYVSASGHVLAQVEVRQVGPIPTLCPTYRIDHFEWTLSP